MTDKEKLVALLTEFGVSPEIELEYVELEAKHGGVGGYSGFFCSFEFDVDGKFKSVSVWE